jgi:hypothetical protein
MNIVAVRLMTDACLVRVCVVEQRVNIVAFHHTTDAWLVCLCGGAAREYCGIPSYDGRLASLFVWWSSA